MNIDFMLDHREERSFGRLCPYQPTTSCEEEEEVCRAKSKVRSKKLCRPAGDDWHKLVRSNPARGSTKFWQQVKLGCLHLDEQNLIMLFTLEVKFSQFEQDMLFHAASISDASKVSMYW